MKKKTRFMITGFHKDDAYAPIKEKYIGAIGHFVYADDYSRTSSVYTSGDFILDFKPDGKPSKQRLVFYMASVKKIA
jgi:hypothetical protein